MEGIIILILILFNGVFVLAEIALVSAKKTKILERANEEDQRAAKVLKLLEKPERFLSSIQIVITLIGLITGAYSGITLSEDIAPLFEKISFLAPHAHKVSIILVITVVTYFSILLGELLPKMISMNNPEKVAMIVASPIVFLIRITRPINIFLSLSLRLIQRVLHLPIHNENPISEEELKIMIRMANQQGTLEKSETSFLHNVFRMSDRRARNIMTHRSEVQWIDARTTKVELLDFVCKNPYHYYPVCKGSFEDIIGVLSLKKLLRNINQTPFSLEQAMEPPVFIPETLEVLQIIEIFRKNKKYLGLVVNEFGDFEGIITLHDLTENVFGHLPGGDRSTDPLLVKREDGSFLADGSIMLDELIEHTGFEIKIEDYQQLNLAGFIIEYLEKLPVTGEIFEISNFRFEIVDMDQLRIDKVLLIPHQAEIDKAEG
ncbi:MAG: hemolysin family protein [Bacteroidota bacterium]|nr:hemolysin family protein [Bacteroidota bacterium]